MLYVKLYLLTIKITIMGFGGAYSIWAMIDRELVVTCNADKGRDMVKQSTSLPKAENPLPLHICRDQFNSIFGVGEILPGPQINAISILAFQDLGLPGMLVMIVGLISPGIFLAPFLFGMQMRLKHSLHLQSFLSGAVIATMAILLVFFLNLAFGLLGRANLHSFICLLFLVSAFWASYRFRINPLAIVITAAAGGYFLLQ